MKTYYYINAARQQAGPIAINDFSKNNITAETIVWCNGMPDWKRAGDIAELSSYFKAQTPPPYQQTPPLYQSQNQAATPPIEEQCPNNYMVFSILSTLLCCLPAGIVAIIYASKVEKDWVQGNKAEAKKNSEQAKMWCIISLAGGVIAGIIGFICGFLGAL